MSHLKVDDSPIIVKRRFNISKEVLWTIVTDLEHMSKWFFENIPVFRAEPGFKVKFLVTNEDRKFTHQWKVKKVKEFKRLKINWTFKEYPGKSYSLFKLKDDGDGCIFTLKAVVTKDFPTDVPEFQRASCEGGWDYFINQRLKEYVESL